LIWSSFRRDGLCDFRPRALTVGCPDVIEIRDEDSGDLIRRERCLECKLTNLDAAIAQHPALHRVFDLDFALTAGVSITLQDIDVEEFRALKILRHERDKYQAEQSKNAPKS
jgi:hypothetical protein